MIVRFGVRTGLVEQEWQATTGGVPATTVGGCALDTTTAPDSFPGPYYPVLECTLHNSRQTWVRQQSSERGSSITELCCVLHELRSRTSPQKRLLPLPCSLLLRRIRLDRGHASLRAACFFRVPSLLDQGVWTSPRSGDLRFLQSSSEVSHFTVLGARPAPQFVCATRVSEPSSVLPQPNLDLPPSLARVLISNTVCSELDSCAHSTLVS